MSEHDRNPLPPEVLAGALQDTVHIEKKGESRLARSVKVKLTYVGREKPIPITEDAAEDDIESCKECGSYDCGYEECCPGGLSHLPTCSHAVPR